MEWVLLVPICMAAGVGVSAFMAWMDDCMDAERRRVGETKRRG